jgi:hypothetical protein
MIPAAWSWLIGSALHKARGGRDVMPVDGVRDMSGRGEPTQSQGRDDRIGHRAPTDSNAIFEWRLNHNRRVRAALLIFRSLLC